MTLRVALAQMCSGIDPAANAEALRLASQEAKAQQADILFTPEMTGLLDRNRQRAASHVVEESQDKVLATARNLARDHQMWIALGSLALRADDEDENRWVNRSFLIDPQGDILARYDKIHLFDVELENGEAWRESAAYLPGENAAVASIKGIKLGMSVCYDLRFPALFAALGDAGADILAVPAAFTVPTGEAHWEVLLRARAIEAGAFVIAAAQSGHHEDGRETYGHSMVIDPWGEVLLDLGTKEGVATCEIDLDQIARVRGQIPAVANRRTFVRPGVGK